MGIVVDGFEALIIGYFGAVVVYLCFSYLVTRLGRNVLMNDDRMNPVYFLFMAIAWLISAAIGSFISFNAAPFGTIGSWIFTITVGFILIGVILRNHNERKHQQSTLINLLYAVCILGGCVAGDLLRLRSLSR